MVENNDRREVAGIIRELGVLYVGKAINSDVLIIHVEIVFFFLFRDFV